MNLVEQLTGTVLPTDGQSFTDTNDIVALKAVAAGITAGKGAGRFAPNDPITRQEICVMLRQVIRLVGDDILTNPSTQLGQYADAASVAGWAEESMAVLTNNGLMAGGDGNRLAPLSNTTVQESIVLILALYNKF